MDFFLLARHEHRGHAQQLKLRPRHLGFGQHLINDVAGQVEGLRLQLHFLVQQDEPVDQHSAHPGVDLGLGALFVDAEGVLLRSEVVEDLLRVGLVGRGLGLGGDRVEGSGEVLQGASEATSVVEHHSPK